MKVEAVSSFSDDDEKNLQILLEAFGSAVSLDAIASSYCETGRNLESTAEMLRNMQGSISATLEDPKKADKASSESSSSSSLLEESHIVKPNSRKCSASIGTVSSVIGKDYINPRPQPKELNEKLKPAKLNSNDFPDTEIWGEEKESEFTSQGQPMENDLGEFLYKMLGNGFQLGMGVIQQVIGQCGYNMPVIIDKLFDISAATIEKNDDVIGLAAVKNMENINDVGSTSCPEQSQHLRCPRRDASGGDESILRGTDMKKKDTQREILVSLFSVPDRIQDHQASTRPVTTRRQSAYGRIVAKPLEENLIEDFTFITRQPINDKNNEANEESYDEMEKAWKENWVTMKEYYKASGDAFVKKDFETAQSLLEQGDFYKEKAREAHEKSAQKLIANSNEDEEVCLNVHNLDPKEARDHMKVQLSSLCGSLFRFMKVVVGTTGSKKDLRRKHMITKLLEKEGVSWTEEGNGWIISIQVDEIDPRKLSFFK